MAFTQEQQLAIDTHGTNLIVSAGAGSGKTAVLTERIFKMVENGQDVSRLLVLTFTKAAALEMKERIKNRLIRSGQYEEQVDKMDSAYITNFDAYLLSLVKKYHYLLNVDKNVSIVDGGLILLKKQAIITEIFQELYLEKDEQFANVLKLFTKKSDDSFKEYILKIAECLEKMVGKDQYLNNYLDSFFSIDAINNKIQMYNQLLLNVLEDMLSPLNELYGLTIGSKYAGSVLELIHFIESKPNYGMMKSFFNSFSFARVSKIDEYTKVLKDEFVSNHYKPFVDNLLVYKTEEEIRQLLIDSKQYVEVIIGILQKYFSRLKTYKMQNSLFEFNDIAMLCLELLNKNPDIRLEIMNSFDEILVDEYQDTSDIQETFVNLLSRDNVYMVGDIKQSIYRFRNANPYIFKEKYNLYKKQDGGIKIDLTKNFRSRKEVLNNINMLFSHLMSEEYGDADYFSEHQMNYGNLDYDQYYQKDFDYNMQVLSYEPDETKIFSNNEIEIFIMATEIKKLINSQIQIYDKENKCLRSIKYSDIAIILDKSTAYDLIQQIFVKEGIPVEVTNNETISNHLIARLISSLFNLVSTVDSNDKMFAYYFLSVARSFLVEMSDNEILSYSFNHFKDNSLYEMAKELKCYSYSHSPINTFEFMLEKFGVYDKLVKVGDVEKSLDIITYIAGLVESLSNLGNTFDDIADYFNASTAKDIEIKVTKKGVGNGVQLLNIHQSKGLEYPICFFAIMNTKFNLKDLDDLFTFDKNFGIVTPFFNDRVIPSIDKFLLKQTYILEEISEKIRLFYVALTRAREKMYFVVPNLNGIKECASPRMFRKLIDLFNFCKDDVMKYTKFVDYKKFVHKNYLLTSSSESKALNDDKPMVFKDSLYVASKLEKGKISKELAVITDHRLDENLILGTHLHAILETIDLKQKDISSMSITEQEKNILTKVLNLSCFNSLEDAKIYQELEFIFEDQGVSYHGIIDLLIEHPDHFEIVDYKLYHTDKEEYKRQLGVYLRYLNLLSDKPVKLYLLSLMKAELKEVLL